MNRKTLFLLFGLFLSSFPLMARSAADEEKILTVYCYDTFSSEWGPGPALAQAFTESTGISLRWNAPGDAVMVLNQLIAEKKHSKADVVVGLDDSLLGRAVSEGILEVYDSPALSNIDPGFLFDNTLHLLPFDHGLYAVCYDSETLPQPPSSLEELTLPQYADSLILMDPRTSTPGLGFLLWTVTVYGEDWPDYWMRLKPSILTVTDSWNQAYALFTSGEAPMMLSYDTSPVYHAEYEQSRRYRAAEFTDGHVRQIEGMGIIAGTENRAEAEAFIDFMLGEEAQKLLAMHNIMLPVNPEVKLPPSFSMVFSSPRILDASSHYQPAITENLIRRWTALW